ncbi:MAG TPA: hypothetical protein VN665_02770 [Candidatus Paceibacterota bacterium]|nr:hypothetical protein [Candidatus Paceibacterota bacterium]
MSSKSAGARAGKEITIAILEALQNGFVKLNLLDASNLVDVASLFPPSYAMHNRIRLARKMKNMEALGYITQTKKGYVVGFRGKRLLNEETIWKLTIPTPTQWDKKWRFVVFDIPVDKRKRRDIFRLRLKELGLKLYQNSVWVYPYPLENIVEKVNNFYHLSKHVSFITAETVTGEKKMKQHFKLN